MAVNDASALDATMLLLFFAVIGFQQGIQLTSEEIYTYNSVDKDLTNWCVAYRPVAELCGATLAALLSFVLATQA